LVALLLHPKQDNGFFGLHGLSGRILDDLASVVSSAEIIRMKWEDTSLVILSACDSAKGFSHGLHGTLNMPRV
jgi:hypothetical protein